MRLRMVLLILIMLFCYAAPWVVNPGVSLTLGGYDLAEWTSLHYVVRAESPALLTSFSLRLPLALLALLIGLTSPRKLLSLVGIALIAAALLPPLEILDNPGDTNYLQQALIALIALIGGLLGWSDLLRRYARPISVGVGIIGVAVVMIGLINGYNLMRGFALPVQIGFGGVGLAALFALSVIVTRNEKSARTRGS